MIKVSPIMIFISCFQNSAGQPSSLSSAATAAILVIVAIVGVVGISISIIIVYKINSKRKGKWTVPGHDSGQREF